MKLLIADDDRISGIMLEKHAKAMGFEPVYVDNGKDAYGLLSRPRGPKIALLDWMMPGMTGPDIIRRLREDAEREGGRHYLIILTARNEQEDVVAALRAGADDYIIKPFDPEELKARLDAGRRIIRLTENLSQALAEARRLSNFIARFDQITGLPNYLNLLEEIERIRSISVPYALFLINLDGFKVVNQVYGISQGDVILNFAGAKIKQALGFEIFVARVAADEFAALVPLDGKGFEEYEKRIDQVAKRLHQAFEQPFTIENEKVSMTISTGVALILPEMEGGGDEFIRRANFAVKRAKKAGGNRTVVHDPEAERSLQERYRLERELKEGIAAGQLEMYLQPQFTHAGRPVAAEALVRWNHPSRGLIFPGDFIPVAEESDLITGIGEVMITQACSLVAAHPELDFRISVNVSPRQFQHPSFAGFVRDTIDASGADPSRLMLEVTEGLLIDEVESVIEKMQELASLGIGFSVDDFGTGYSSLIYLKRLPIKELKIDRAFVMDIPQDLNDVAIVKAIVAIARHFGFGLVAEGIETEEQVRFLSECGQMLYQGYYFARPAPADQVVAEFLEKVA